MWYVCMSAYLVVIGSEVSAGKNAQEGRLATPVRADEERPRSLGEGDGEVVEDGRGGGLDKAGTRGVAVG